MGDIEDNASPEDVFRIMIATDIHLGYAEKDAIRDMDSYNTFEEILQLSVQNNVDFLLLGGDLFHDAQPSAFGITKCLELLKKYCLGDRPVLFEFLSDQSAAFQNSKSDIVNYEDPNMNIGLPVFSIHGNHDDPSGQKNISALDLLSSSGLVNYFGKWNDLTNVIINPICLSKGSTKLALYGLSHIKDERLGRLFREKKVIINKPENEDWFNLLVLHQNRAERGPKNFIPASSLPAFIDLVIWGHEHDCRIDPEPAGDCYISQPGSSVATSLAQGESIPKKIGILEVYKTGFKMHPIPLKTVRPFIYDELMLVDPTSKDYSREQPQEQAIGLVKETMETLIQRAKDEYEGDGPPPLPLIRLVVRYYNERQEFNHIKLGAQYQGRIANPQDCLLLRNIKATSRGGNKIDAGLFIEKDDENFKNVHQWATSVVDVLRKQLENEDNPRLTVLSTAGVIEAVSRFVDSNDIETIGEIAQIQMEKTLNKLMEMDVNIDGIDQAIQDIRDQRLENDDVSELTAALNNTQASRHANNRNTVSIISSDDEEVMIDDVAVKLAKGRGSRGGRGSRARAANAGAASSPGSSRGRGSRGGKGRGRAKAS